MNSDKWKEICFLLSDNIRIGISESDFERSVIQALRVLDWKEFSGDIEIRPSIQIGSAKRITPDLVIKSTESRNLFVIEIKQPDLPFTTGYQQQLFSYMRQLRLKYGVLIGQAIQIFYDGDLADTDDPVLLETIYFDSMDAKGEKFVELFLKETFSLGSLDKFTDDCLKKMDRNELQSKLLLRILANDFKSKVLELIKQDFLNQYDSELIDEVLQKISIIIAPKQQIDFKKPKSQAAVSDKLKFQNSRDKTRYIINKNGRILPKNRFVLEFVIAYLNKNPSNFSKLKNVFKDEYQGSIGVINSLDFVETKFANKSDKRHFMGKGEILVSQDNVKFVVSTQWGIFNVFNIVDLAIREGFEIEEV
jgi:hypothetical protein